VIKGYPIYLYKYRYATYVVEYRQYFVSCKYNKEGRTASTISQLGKSEMATKRSRPNRDHQKECGSWTTAEEIRAQSDKKIWIQYAILIACHSYQEGIAGETDTNHPAALRNAHRALGRAFKALIGREFDSLILIFYGL
jgi:hypothetical protein